MARRVFDFLLRGHYPSDEDLALTRVGKSSAPVGTPRRAADVLLPGQLPAAPVAAASSAVPAPIADATATATATPAARLAAATPARSTR